MNEHQIKNKYNLRSKSKHTHNTDSLNTQTQQETPLVEINTCLINQPTQNISESLDIFPAEDVSQAAVAMKPATTKAGKPRVRMKWDKEINMFIMRTYYSVTKLETDFTTYRQQMHQKFIEKYKNTEITEQRISDQKRFIIRNKRLSDEELKIIRDEVAKEIEREELQISRGITRNTQYLNRAHTNIRRQNRSNRDNDLISSTIINTNVDLQVVQDKQPINEINTEALIASFEANLSKYNGTDPTSRPALPKIKTSRYLTYLIRIFNKDILPIRLNSIETITDTHTLIYCTALTIAEHLNIKIYNRSNSNSYKKPAWQIRLEKDIEDLRKDIGRLTQYKSGNNSKKLCKKVKEILNKTKQHSSREQSNIKINEYLDTLKQKLAVKSHRLARYKKAKDRKDNNRLFTTSEKQFYRKMKNTNNYVIKPPSTESLKEFWSKVWTYNAEHNREAEWIHSEIARSQFVQDMEFDDIDDKELQCIINKTHNWKAAGIDGIHNYWLKKLVVVHNKLAKQITDIIKGVSSLPEFLSKGRTFLLPKNNNTEDPSQYRPITCLPTLYKIITSVIANRIYKHLEQFNILSEEQKGCRRHHMGCKEQLIIDSTILKHIQKSKKDLFITYIDYQKAFDSIPHSWLIQVLEIYKINNTLINFLKNVMATWKTSINLNTNRDQINIGEIEIKRGIFQGDSLSPLWFCLALNPLSQQLNNTKFGLNIKNDKRSICQLTHLLYMDDLKLYSGSNINMDRLLDITVRFTKDIKMDFGLNKCRKLNIKKGTVMGGSYNINEEQQIPAMESNELYKYLGYNQSQLLEHAEIKDSLKKEYIKRIHTVCKQQLSSKNLFKAINTYAVPILTYSFGVIKWTKTELKQLEIKTRTILTQNRHHHPKSAIERVCLSRKEGGRGLIDITQLHNKQVNAMKVFFYSKKEKSQLHKAVIQIDKKYTPLNLSEEHVEIVDTKKITEEKHSKWKGKELHGRHKHDLDQAHIDSEASNKWLELAGLFPETEGFIIAIQDQVITTKNYRKYILKDSTMANDLCRKCLSKPETIQHITGACIKLTQNDYTHRHNQVSNIIHQKLVLKYKLIREPHTPYYKYSPSPVLENSTHKIYYDRTILTDHTIYNNRPDITFVDKLNKHTFIIDIAVPNTNNIQSTIVEKTRKYTELQEEIKKVWKMNTVTIVPIVISSTGVVPKQLSQALKILDLPKFTYITLQKAAILNTCRIVRKFLQINKDNEDSLQVQ